MGLSIFAPMDIVDLCDYCLSLQDVEQTFPFGPDVIVFKVNSKIFCLIPLDSPTQQFNVKCNPETAVELREQYPCVLPGYHMNKKHWNTIVIDGTMDSSQLRKWIDHSYELVRG